MGICMYLCLCSYVLMHVCCTRITCKMSRRDIVRKYCLCQGYPPTIDFRPFHASIGLGLLPLFLLILFETSVSCLATFLAHAGRITISPWDKSHGLDRVFSQCCFTSLTSLDGSSSYSFLSSPIWIGKKFQE